MLRAQQHSTEFPSLSRFGSRGSWRPCHRLQLLHRGEFAMRPVWQPNHGGGACDAEQAPRWHPSSQPAATKDKSHRNPRWLRRGNISPITERLRCHGRRLWSAGACSSFDQGSLLPLRPPTSHPNSMLPGKQANKLTRHLPALPAGPFSAFPLPAACGNDEAV